MGAHCLLRRAIVVAGLIGGCVGQCGCQPEALLVLLPTDGVDVPTQSPPFMMSTGAEPQVYLLLGYNDVYSTGLMDLAAKMNAQGLHAKWLNNSDWLTLLDEIKQARTKGTLKGDLIFVGHSFGGDDAVNISRKLTDASIPVRLVALIDATSPAPIPANVDYCYNLYEPSLFGDLFPNSFPGNPVEPDPGNTHTVIMNQIISVDTFGPEVAKMNHLTIDSSPVIHQAVIDKIREIEALPGSSAVKQGS